MLFYPEKADFTGRPVADFLQLPPGIDNNPDQWPALEEEIKIEGHLFHHRRPQFLEQLSEDQYQHAFERIINGTERFEEW
jgi:hypothetical protein